jgi:hypothetical protein
MPAAGDEAGADALMAEEWILENAHLRMRVPLGGKVQSLCSRQYQRRCYMKSCRRHVSDAADGNRVAGNRFFSGT